MSVQSMSYSKTRRVQKFFAKMRIIYHTKRIEIFGYLVLLTVIVYLYTIHQVTHNRFHNEESNTQGETFDVVYTWVNGSDEHFRETVLKYNPDFEADRYDDKNELKFSLRSLEKYAPWLGHVYIVTNGQIPSWLNLDYEKVSVISHDELIDDPRILPTFSSPVIEQFLHRIKNLSKRFVYFNDDIFLGSELYPEDLYSESNGISIFEINASPTCATFCNWKSLGNGQCDRYCNVEECQFDGNDCKGFFGEMYLPDLNRVKKQKSRFIFLESLVTTNKALTLAYGLKQRYAASHVPFLWDKDIIADMIRKFQNEFNLSNFERFRTHENIQFPFMYYNYVQSETHYLSISEIFDKFDTDNSTTWSAGEVRILIAQLYQLPLNSKKINDFEKFIKNCDQSLRLNRIDKNLKDTHNISKEYFHWEYPNIGESFVVNCKPLVKILLKNFGERKKHKFRKIVDGLHNHLVMVSYNIPQSENNLDQLRKTPKKFNCINDERNSKSRATEDLIINNLLEDFYLSLFPYPSKFELAENYHNRINYIGDYLKHDCQNLQLFLLVTVIMLLLVIFFKIRYDSYMKYNITPRLISFYKYRKY